MNVEVTAQNFTTRVTALWIIPGTTTASAGEHVAVHLEAYRSKFGAWRAVAEHHNKAAYDWADFKPKAIEFRSRRHKEPMREGELLQRHAPRQAWVVADLSNGSYFEDDGRVWVFVFKTRQAARDYVAAAKATTPYCCAFSTPVLMYQQPA